MALTIWDADHSTNADDLIALGQANNTSVIYANQSAAGLTATLAPDAIEQRELSPDATDSESLSAGEANRISTPV